MPGEGFETAQDLSSGFTEQICAVAITTHHGTTSVYNFALK